MTYISIFTFFITGLVSLCAGTVALKDGSTIKGRITLIRHGKASVKTALGNLKVPVSKIKTMMCDHKLWIAHDSKGSKRELSTLHYKNGSYILHPGLETQRKVKSLAAAWDKSQNDPFIYPWKNEISFYYIANSGNISSENTGGRFKSSLVKPSSRFDIILKTAYLRQEKRELRNESKGEVDYERNCDPRNTLYTMSLLEHNAVKGIKLRQAYGSGYGRYLIKATGHSLRARLGLQYRNDLYEDDIRWEGPALDMELMHQLRNELCGSFKTKVSYSPKLDSQKNYKQLLYHETSWDIPITKGSWRLRAGIKNYYDEEPLQDRSHLDTQYYLTLAYSW